MNYLLNPAIFYDKVHERLGKLVTVRSRPHAIKLVKPSELASVQQLIHYLSKVSEHIQYMLS